MNSKYLIEQSEGKIFINMNGKTYVIHKEKGETITLIIRGKYEQTR
jgi:hypothetical protein